MDRTFNGCTLVMTCATDPELTVAIGAAIEPILFTSDDDHLLGCHNPRVPGRICFREILIRLVTGSSWSDIDAIVNFEVSDTTLRARRHEWIDAGQDPGRPPRAECLPRLGDQGSLT